MMGDARDIARMLGEKASPKVPTRVRATVTKVEPSRTWVRINGSSGETPCASTSASVKPGDAVSVLITGNRATIEGNYTSPATDDSMAREAIRTGSSAQQTADMAHVLATNAIADAQATRDAAERAEADATRAAVAAESSEASARASATSAASAADSAASAAASAFSANESAESAYLAALGSITSLGTVENVIESLRWLKDNPAYKKCPDGKYIDPTCDYYQIVDGEYVKVENPTVEGIPTYYVIDATATAAAYVDSKLAVTDAGLYVTKDKLLTWAEGDEMPDGSGTIGAPELDEEGNPILDDEGNPVIIGADLIGRPKPQEAGYVLLGVDGVTIYSKEGYPVATYGSSMKLGYGASSTTIESDMIEVIRTDIPTKVEYNVFAAGRRLANPEQPESSTNPMLPFVQFSDGYGHDLFTVDSTGKPTFAKPVPIGSGGTDATNEGDAADNLMVQSIGAGMEIPAGTDLNTLTTPGNYVCGFTSNVAGFANKPTPLTNAFRLTVFKVLGNTEHSANEVHRGQLIMDWTSGREYYRVYNGSSKNWGSWRTKRQDTDVIDVLHGGHGGTTVIQARDNLKLNSIRYTTTSSSAGYIKVKINSKTSWMLAFDISLYQSYKNYVIRISGYNYSTTGTWHAPAATMVSASENEAVTVYFGHDSANDLWVAFPAGQYTGVEISAVTNGYTNVLSTFALQDLFTITRVSSLSGATDKTIAVRRPIYRGESIAVSEYGTGITSNPSMLVNLGSSSAASVFQTSPRPGVTGTLPMGNLPSQVSSWQGVWVAPISIHPTGQGTPIGFFRRGGFGFVILNGCKLGRFTTRQTICAIPTGYGNACSSYSAPTGGHLMIEGGYLKADPELLGDPTWGRYLSLAYPIS